MGDGAIWATRVLFLNDSTEIVPGFKVLRELLVDFRGQTSGWDPGFPAVHRQRGFDPVDLVRVAAWSEDGDLLSQWRGYSGGATGYSIGFSRAKLEQAAIDEAWTLARCVYDLPCSEGRSLRLRMGAFYQSYAAGTFARPYRPGRPMQSIFQLICSALDASNRSHDETSQSTKKDASGASSTYMEPARAEAPRRR